MRRRFRGTVGGAACVAALVLALTGCASTGDSVTEPHDPYEGFNRSMFAFNKVLDDAIFNPIADGYVAVTPEPARRAVFNFFDNLAYLTTVANQLLQGKIERGFEDAGRFVINSTFGMAGLVDFAGGIGMPRHEEDFAQTLGVWGIGEGPYLQLPVLGPRTMRGLPGIPADAATDLLTWLGSTPLDYVLTGVKAVDTRARFDAAIELRDTSSLDPYVFEREAYLQRRRSLVYDGNPPLDLGPATDQGGSGTTR